MKIAVEGCAHGELEKIYETIQLIEKESNIKVDLLLCCGDFQSTRNIDDLQTMAVPKKYHNMGSFYKYYSGELKAPILTIFIGGNHEASNYLQELPYGGWVAPNIYYLGYAGVVKVNGIRIAGLSGIYKGYDYLKGRFEFSPYNDSTKTSVYHIRQLECFRLRQLSGVVDICMSHDWPRGITSFGNRDQLMRFKPHFRDDIESNELGSKPCEDILHTIQPTYWFAAHLHCKFAALVPHKTYTLADLDINVQEKYTKFLALDKCLPKRRFLQIVTIDPPDYIEDNGIDFEYDLEWLTILYITNHLTSVRTSKYYLPGPSSGDSERYKFTPTQEELDHVRKKFPDLKIPNNFSRTAEPYDGVSDYKNCGEIPQPKSQINPQNKIFCDTLGIDDPLSISMVMQGHELSYSSSLNESSFLLDESSEVKSTSPLKIKTLLNLPKPSNDHKPLKKNPEEISISDTEMEETEETSSDEKESSTGQEINENKETLEQKDSGDADSLSSSTPPVKKLRRRNQDLYEAEKEDDQS